MVVQDPYAPVSGPQDDEQAEDDVSTPERLRAPRAAFTCGGCGATWRGTAVAHCGGCHRSFSGPSTFDDHRSQYGDRGACLDPATVLVKTGPRAGTPLLVLRPDGIWAGPEMTDDRKRRAFGRT